MCDTFVVLASATTDGSIIFAKNSDRPSSEIQNITYFPSQRHSNNTTVQCTYIEIPQVEETNAILLSQPLWMFGAEMGTNEHGLVIGNEAVWTKEPLGPPVLLGMDLLRLALERCETAASAIQTIVELLDKYGQGGACAENDSSLSYHNSFLITDRTEAWVLETAGSWWVAELVKEPSRNISNTFSIRSEFDLSAEGIIDYAIEKGYHDQTGSFKFASSFENYWTEPSPFSREGYGRSFLTSKYGNITPLTMMELLRNCESGICMHGGFRTTASMVSHLKDSNKDIHWMTGTPHPCKSFFKPISFPITSLKPYIQATHEYNTKSFWWNHEKLSDSLSKNSHHWQQKEKELFSILKSSNSNQRVEITTKAFCDERDFLDFQLNGSFSSEQTKSDR